MIKYRRLLIVKNLNLTLENKNTNLVAFYKTISNSSVSVSNLNRKSFSDLTIKHLTNTQHSKSVLKKYNIAYLALQKNKKTGSDRSRKKCIEIFK